jgi:sRNA-binding protein
MNDEIREVIVEHFARALLEEWRARQSRPRDEQQQDPDHEDPDAKVRRFPAEVEARSTRGRGTHTTQPAEICEASPSRFRWFN